MENIWRDGYTFTREDGTEIKLTSKEIRDIQYKLQASYGWGSFQYYIDDLEYYKAEDRTPEMEKKLEVAKKLIEDENACYDVWESYMDNVTYDMGYVEWEVVDQYVKDEIVDMEEE